MYDYQTHLMLNVIKVLLGHLCQFVLIKTERAGILQIPRVLSEQSAYKSCLLACEGVSMELWTSACLSLLVSNSHLSNCHLSCYHRF